uniref:hypothetical protein n=1 Tax=Vibrio alfacsensis TaxID=1074311 RepID=UPI001F4A022E|nr:hypothetical protein [Vibrio alfacsensis]
MANAVIAAKRLSHYVLLFFIVLAGLLLSSPLVIPQARFAALADISFYEISVALLLIGAAVVCTFTCLVCWRSLPSVLAL